MDRLKREVGEINKHILHYDWELSEEKLQAFINFTDPDSAYQELIQEVLRLKDREKELESELYSSEPGDY